MSAARSLAALALLLGLGSAQAADVGVVMAPPTTAYADSACSDSGVLGRIKGHFAYGERHTWHRGFLIASLDNPRPSGHPYAEPGVVKRDYCRADSVMTDGRPYPVFYVIEHTLGFAGVGRNVDFCVPGLDPWHIYDGDCRTVR